jgi:hypothetical protein
MVYCHRWGKDGMQEGTGMNGPAFFADANRIPT